MTNFDENDRLLETEAIVQANELFHLNLELEKKVAPRLDEYPKLIAAFEKMNEGYRDIVTSIEGMPPTRASRALVSFLHAAADANTLNVERWKKLHLKNLKQIKYGWFAFRKDTKLWSGAIDARERAGAVLNVEKMHRC